MKPVITVEILAPFLALSLLLFIIILVHTHYPRLKKYTFPSKKLPDNAPSFKILQLSDLHLRKVGFREKTAIRLIQLARPDVIVVTGDIIANRRNVRKNQIKDFFQRLDSNIPIILVRGNAEFMKPDANESLAFLKTLPNVEILSNRAIRYSMNKRLVCLLGLDPYVDTATHFAAAQTVSGISISGGGSWVECFYLLDLPALSNLSHFRIRGRLCLQSADDLSGVLFCAHTQATKPKFYRLTFGNRYPARFSAHGTNFKGQSRSQLVLQGNTWYHYELLINSGPADTSFSAKVWPISVPQPHEDLLSCRDASKHRLRMGMIGFWSARGGESRKYTIDEIYDYVEDEIVPFAIGLSDRFCREFFVDEAPWSDLGSLKTEKLLAQLAQNSSPQSHTTNILLCHDPAVFEYLQDKDFHLLLSGHTHGGQVQLPFIKKWLYKSPLKATTSNNTVNFPTLIINRGLGTSGIPIRFGIRCELILLDIRDNQI